MNIELNEYSFFFDFLLDSEMKVNLMFEIIDEDGSGWINILFSCLFF